MASASICNQIFRFHFYSTFLEQPKTRCSMNTCIPSFSSAVKSASHLNLKMKRIISRASSEDLLIELTEDYKFVPLNTEDANCGSPALLLVGFQVEETAKIQQLLKELDGEFLEVNFSTGVCDHPMALLVEILGDFCTEDMINRSLWEAVNNKQSNLEASNVAKSVLRICFLSGLNGEEMMMFINAFPESGLEAPVFAAFVPNSAEIPLAELIDEIMGDHEMLSALKTG